MNIVIKKQPTVKAGQNCPLLIRSEMVHAVKVHDQSKQFFFTSDSLHFCFLYGAFTWIRLEELWISLSSAAEEQTPSLRMECVSC